MLTQKLLDSYEHAFPEEIALGLTPEIKTIRYKLKPELDYIKENRERR